jgi:glycosyltransferase involved in cell wall biosynthesis
MPDRPLRVCILRHAYFPEDPTVRKEAYTLADSGMSVDVVCLRRPHEPAHEVIRGVRVTRVPVSHERTGIVRYIREYVVSIVLMARAAGRLHAAEPFDLVQANTMPNAIVCAALPLRRRGVPVVVHVHEPEPELWITKFGGGPSGPLFHALILAERFFLRFADSVIAVTEELRERLIAVGTDPAKVWVVPNVCEERFFDAAAPLRAEKAPAGTFRLVTHGLIEDRTGQEDVIRAVDRLRGSMPGLRYEIYGEGGARARLEELVRQLGCEAHVVFRGFVDEAVLLQGLRDADAGIVPMRRSSYSVLVDFIKMYELTALGLPILASRLPVVERRLGERGACFFEPGSVDDIARAIEWMHHHPEVRPELAGEARRRLTPLRWRTAGREYVQRIRELAAHA